MNDKIHDFFAGETMPESCVRRIEQSLEEKSRCCALCQRAAAMAAALLMVLAAANWNAIRVQAQQIYERIIHAVAPELEGQVGQVEPGVEKMFLGAVVSDAENGEKAQSWLSARDGALMEVRDGRIFFIANGEDMDITEQCSQERPFIYAVEDNLGKLHYLIVGGTPESCGGIEAIYDPAEEKWVNFAFDKSFYTGSGTPAWERNAMIELGVYDEADLMNLNPELLSLGNIGGFCQVRNGRLFFTGDGQNMDITEQCSDDTPFIYWYQDGNILYYMAVGGTPERYGSMKTCYDLSAGKWGFLGAQLYPLDDGSEPAWLERAMDEIGYK